MSEQYEPQPMPTWLKAVVVPTALLFGSSPMIADWADNGRIDGSRVEHEEVDKNIQGEQESKMQSIVDALNRIGHN